MFLFTLHHTLNKNTALTPHIVRTLSGADTNALRHVKRYYATHEWST